MRVLSLLYHLQVTPSFVDLKVIHSSLTTDTSNHVIDTLIELLEQNKTNEATQVISNLSDMLNEKEDSVGLIKTPNSTQKQQQMKGLKMDVSLFVHYYTIYSFVL